MATAEPLPVSNLKNAKFVASGQTISNADLNVGFRNKLKQTPVSDLSPTAANLIACQTSDSVLDVMATLIEHDVRALPIFHPPTGTYTSFCDMLDIVSYFVNFTKDFQSDKERVSFLDCGYSANNIFVKSCSTAANASKRNPYFDIHKEYSVQFVINTMSQRNLYRLALSDFKNDFGGMVTQATLVRFLGGRNSMKWMGPIVNRNLSHYQLGSKSNLVFAKESDSLLSAFSKLAEHQIGGIPIINEELVLVGALSASDFKLCYDDIKVQKSLAWMMNPVSSFLSRKSSLESVPRSLGTICLSDTIATLLDKFRETRYHRLFLVESEASLKVTGIVSMRDMLQLFYREGIVDPLAQGPNAAAMKRRRDSLGGGEAPGGWYEEDEEQWEQEQGQEVDQIDEEK